MRNYWDDPPDSLDESYPPILWKARQLLKRKAGIAMAIPARERTLRRREPIALAAVS
jgi:hypothetical protein